LPAVIAGLGEVVFWKVRMRPGMPVLFGLIGSVPVLALPGNPVSVFATFIALARPALAALSGCAELDPPPLRACLAQSVEKRHQRLELRRARSSCSEDGRIVVQAHPLLSSGALRSVAESDVLIELEAQRTRFEAGEVVSAHRIAIG
jgi:molybdopterin molybdotransferase